jgi:hypothetical protein
MFGYQISGPRERYWGARAIYKTGQIELLVDRQTTEASLCPETTSFMLWLNGYALPWLRAEVKRLHLAPDDPQEIMLNQFKYELRASTNRSHGYLYIGAVEHTLVDDKPRINTTTNESERVVLVRDDKIIVDKSIVPVGTEGVVNVNSIGPAKVVGYSNESYGEYKLACLLVEVYSPPEWWVKQTMRIELEEAVKTGIVPLKRGSTTEPSPKAAKEFKRNWKPKPFSIWSADFTAKVA